MLCFFSESNTIWTSGMARALRKELVPWSSKSQIIGTHSNINTTSKKNYLPGGIVSIFMNAIYPHINTHNIHKDVLGQWSATIITQKNISILLINMYKIPDSSNCGPYTSLNQYNERLLLVKDAKY